MKLSKFLLHQETVETEDVSKGKYGNMPMIQSASKPDVEFVELKDLTTNVADKKVWVRARLQTSRAKGWFRITQ